MTDEGRRFRADPWRLRPGHGSHQSARAAALADPVPAAGAKKRKTRFPV